MSQRIDENLSGHNNAARDYVRLKSKQVGEYIDQFCTVPDKRTVEEVVEQIERFCMPAQENEIEEALEQEKFEEEQQQRADEEAFDQ